MTNDVSVNVDIRADQALALYRQQALRTQRRHEEEMARREQQAVAVLQTLLRTELDPGLLAALGITYEVMHRERTTDPPHVKVVFFYAGLDWHISQEDDRGDWKWTIRAMNHGSTYSSHHELSASAEPTHLEITLLLKLGECREQMRRAQQEAAEQEQRQQLAVAAAQAREEQAALQMAQQIAKADEEHACLTEQFGALKEQALATLWRWPDGVRISLYRVTYCAGIGRGENEEPVLEHEGGWTGTDQVDAEGYVRLEPAKTFPWSRASSSRDIKLSSALLPIWQRLTIGDVDDLPEGLREEVKVWLPGVVLRQDERDGKQRFVQVGQELRYGDETPYQETVGQIPLSWVRSLVEQAANETP